MVFQGHEPGAVLEYFYGINQIPRGSGNEKAVSDYIADFARKLNFTVIQDEFHNLIIKKPAAAGYENHEPIILQAHLDMVCEKNADTVHDFTKDPISMYIDGDLIKARGTTLGADNAMGMALCMALLSHGKAHPALEVVFTSEEEAGMGGAQKMDVSALKARRMLNLDSSTDKMFIMGCAAGTMIEYQLSANWDNPTDDSVFLSISIKGLIGGHSGTDIHRERGNSLKILGHMLNALSEKINFNIATVAGGMKVNAIPREANAVVVIPGASSRDA